MAESQRLQAFADVWQRIPQKYPLLFESLPVVDGALGLLPVDEQEEQQVCFVQIRFVDARVAAREERLVLVYISNGMTASKSTPS